MVLATIPTLLKTQLFAIMGTSGNTPTLQNHHGFAPFKIVAKDGRTFWILGPLREESFGPVYLGRDDPLGKYCEVKEYDPAVYSDSRELRYFHRNKKRRITNNNFIAVVSSAGKDYIISKCASIQLALVPSRK